MPCKSTSGAKRKRPASKVSAVTQGLSSVHAQKAAIGNENQPLAATLLLVTPLVSTSVRRSVRCIHGGAKPPAPALDKGMATCYYCLLLTPLIDNTAPADSDVVQDLSPAHMCERNGVIDTLHAENRKLLALVDNTACTDSDVVQDLSPAEMDAAVTHVTLSDASAEVANLCGKYLTHFMHKFIYFICF
jgi:hypothetical protein